MIPDIENSTKEEREEYIETLNMLKNMRNNQ